MMSGLQVIVGLGATGLSCAAHLRRQGVSYAMTDSRAEPPNLNVFKAQHPDVPISVGGIDQALLQQASRIILSPGIALREPAIAACVKRGIPVIGDIELFAESVKVPVIAITGTNAKSTVTTLVGLMAEAAGMRVGVGGNLGIPALTLLERDNNAALFVLELSSFQLETTYSLRPRVATVLNISPDHMDRYDTLSDYCEAKWRVYANAESIVCNRDDSLTVIDHPCRYFFTQGEPDENQFGLTKADGVVYLTFGNERLLSVKEMPVSGKHYHANALAALAIGYASDFPMNAMLHVLKTFKGLPHRCEFTRERKGVAWYNDSKGTNVGATQAAIEGLGSDIDGKLVLILGGVGKNADFSPLLPLIESYARHVVLIGEAAPTFKQLIGDRLSHTTADSLQAAVEDADKHAKVGDAVLLSPACASFDMFKNFEHRGDVFKDIVSRMT